jgi:hypothetical protein
MLPVQQGARRLRALAHLRAGAGKPRPSYIHLVVEAARGWGCLSPTSAASLVAIGFGARAKDTGELG